MRDAARRRLLDVADPVAAELVRLALHDPDSRVRLAACRDVLDRAGIVRANEVQIITVDAVEREIARLEAELGNG